MIEAFLKWDFFVLKCGQKGEFPIFLKRMTQDKRNGNRVNGRTKKTKEKKKEEDK